MALPHQPCPLPSPTYQPCTSPTPPDCPPARLQTGQYSTQIFSLAVLLSSLFVFNQMGGIDEAALDRLSLVTEMTKHIRVRASGGGSCVRSPVVGLLPLLLLTSLKGLSGLECLLPNTGA